MTGKQSSRQLSKGKASGSRTGWIRGWSLGARPKYVYVRSEAYRRFVSSQACFACGIEGFSQAAHPNQAKYGKGRGIKASDAFCFPLCGPHGASSGCHFQLDLSIDMTKSTQAAGSTGSCAETGGTTSRTWKARLSRALSNLPSQSVIPNEHASSQASILCTVVSWSAPGSRVVQVVRRQDHRRQAGSGLSPVSTPRANRVIPKQKRRPPEDQ
jgi:hypothetical protein